MIYNIKLPLFNVFEVEIAIETNNDNGDEEINLGVHLDIILVESLSRDTQNTGANGTTNIA